MTEANQTQSQALGQQQGPTLPRPAKGEVKPQPAPTPGRFAIREVWFINQVPLLRSAMQEHLRVDSKTPYRLFASVHAVTVEWEHDDVTHTRVVPMANVRCFAPLED